MSKMSENILQTLLPGTKFSRVTRHTCQSDWGASIMVFPKHQHELVPAEELWTFLDNISALDFFHIGARHTPFKSDLKQHFMEYHPESKLLNSKTITVSKSSHTHWNSIWTSMNKCKREKPSTKIIGWINLFNLKLFYFFLIWNIYIRNVSCKRNSKNDEHTVLHFLLCAKCGCHFITNRLRMWNRN